MSHAHEPGFEMFVRLRSVAILFATLFTLSGLALPVSAVAAGLQVTFQARPPAIENSRTAPLRWTVRQGKDTAKGVSITCRLDGRVFRTCDSTKVLVGQAQGRHSFVVTATKRVGSRTLSDVAVVRWNVDTRVPSKPQVQGSPTPWSPSAVTLTASRATDPGSGIKRYESQVSPDGGKTWKVLVRSGASRTIAKVGVTRVRFRAVDKAGNVGPYRTTSVRVDDTIPAVPTATGGSASWSNAATRSVVATSFDSLSGVDRIEYSTSSDAGTTWSVVQVGATATISAEGTTLVRFRAVDEAGNTSAFTTWPTADTTVKLDHSAPTGTLAGVPATSTGTVTTINGTHLDQAGLSGVASWYVRYSGGPTPMDFCASGAASPVSCPSIDTTLMTSGDYTVQLWVTDVAGNAVVVASTPTTVETAYTDTYVSGTMPVWVDSPGTADDGSASIWASTSPIPGAAWIATRNGPFITGPFVFTASFVLPSGALNGQVAVSYIGDDYATATINGVGGTPAVFYNGTPATVTRTAVVGTNNLRFDVPNSSGNGGMAFKAVVTYVTR